LIVTTIAARANAPRAVGGWRLLTEESVALFPSRWFYRGWMSA
jgi:hypothetical protein